VALLRERVKPAEAVKVDTDRVAKLIADLDADELEKRETATDELAKLGKAAEATLRAEQKKGASASAEVRVRLGQLLDRLEKGELPPDERRALRAVEVLEMIGTQEARAALAGLAKGAADAVLTREAKAAMERLEPQAKK
jgi:hypothetical protein